MQSYSYLKNIPVLLTLLVSTCFTSCKKFIEVEPPTNRISEGNVFKNDLTAIAAITGIYSNISQRGLTTPDLLTFSKLAGLSADEFDLWSGALEKEQLFYKNDLKSIPGGLNAGVSAGNEFWNICYVYIYNCNQAIKGIEESATLSSFVKEQLLGEAKFLRAFFYFYLVNLYGDVPIVKETDPDVNRMLHRSAVVNVYDFIISDLEEAKNALSENFLNSGLLADPLGERLRPTKWAASALLARAYLYKGNFAKAESEASIVINHTALFSVNTVPLANVFLKNSNEAIWQLQPVTNGWNTMYLRWFHLSASPAGFTTTKSVRLNSLLYNSFEAGDNRKSVWTGSYTTGTPATTYFFPAKYKAGSNSAITATNPGAITEYHMVLRLGEQYLIRAEARAMQGNIAGAVADLNVLRTRARATPTVTIPNPLPNLTVVMTQGQVLDAVIQERKVELFSEWGHRWLDLKRTGRVDAVMSSHAPLKGGIWQTTDQLYPIPAEDVLRNSNLTQNPGY